MKRQFELSQGINEAMAEDQMLIFLHKEKQKLLNQLNPKYILDKENNKVTAFFDQSTTEKLDKIDLLVKLRIDQLKRFYV